MRPEIDCKRLKKDHNKCLIVLIEGGTWKKGVTTAATPPGHSSSSSSPQRGHTAELEEVRRSPTKGD